jgi:hypothetical protein
MAAAIRKPPRGQCRAMPHYCRFPAVQPAVASRSAVIASGLRRSRMRRRVVMDGVPVASEVGSSRSAGAAHAGS